MALEEALLLLPLCSRVPLPLSVLLEVRPALSLQPQATLPLPFSLNLPQFLLALQESLPLLSSPLLMISPGLSHYPLVTLLLAFFLKALPPLSALQEALPLLSSRVKAPPLPSLLP